MLHCFPTTDIHLLNAPGRNRPIELHGFAVWPPNAATKVWTDLSTVPTLNLGLSLIGGAGVVTVVSHVTGAAAPVAGPVFTVTPIGVGTKMAQTTLAAPPGITVDLTDQMRPLRFTVHADVDRFWIAVRSITMFADEANWILPITAIFDDASQGDATSHPYWTYTSSDLSVAAPDLDGRIHAKKAGTATITVTLDGTTKTQSVVVTVKDALSASNPATVIPWGSVSGDRNRLYVISEGYTDPVRFEDHFKDIVGRWFSRENSPFDLLRDRFAVFGISDMVAVGGITIGPPLDANAIAAPTTIAPAAIGGPLRIVDEGDTRFGMIYGGRIGDPQARKGLPANLASFLAAPRAPRAIGVDWRRLADVHTDPQVTFIAFVRRYLAAVALGATGMPAGFGDLTADDRVIILCDDQLRGGQLLAVAGLEQQDRLIVTAAAGSNPGFQHVVADPTEPRRFSRTIGFTMLRSPVASTVVHEVGHSYRLGDEYEINRGKPGPATLAGLERFENLQSLAEIADATGSITSRPVKWYVPRVVHAARVTTAIVTGLKVALAVAGADKLGWITPGAKLMLRGTFRTPRAGAGLPRLWLYDVTVDTVTPTGVFVTSTVDIPEPEIVIGAVLYQPMLDSNGPIRLIAPSVTVDLGTNGVFPKPPVRIPDPAHPGDACFDQDRAAADESVNARAIAGGPTTPDRWRIIGAHEGGDDISCGIVRPTGRCKLRRAVDFTTSPITVWPFCHVCQYVIVDLVDPGLHARLDKDYPP